MRFPFDPSDGLIIVRTAIDGPASDAIIRLAFDTGATRTLINTRILTACGYDPGLAKERMEVTTGSGVEYCPVISINRIECLGVRQKNMSVLSHTLPPSAGIDGLDGLDFFRAHTLLIDLQKGMIELR